MTTVRVLFVVAFAVSFATACGKKKKDESHFDGPAVAPIVASATPPALQPTGATLALSSALTGINTDVLAYLQSLFKDSYNKISGGSGIGFVNSQLEDLDSRVAEINGRTVTGSTCLNNTANPYTLDASSLNPMLKLTMNLQCADSFNDGGDGTSGMNFGQNGSDYSLWLYLSHGQNLGGFGYVANLTGVGSSDETVDYIFLDHSPQYNDRVSTTRLRAKPSTNAFEMYYATTDINASGNTAHGGGLNCGFGMISDGKLVYAKGNAQPLTGSDCTAEEAFEVCVDAVTLKVATAGACDKLKTSFTITGTIGPKDLKGKGTTVDSVIPVSSAASATTKF